MTEKIYWIQVLRGVAAVMVLLFHARPHIESSQILQQYAKMFNHFFSGVDIFFVLSGFVVYTSSLRYDSIKLFFLNRILRIYAGYWPVFLLFVFFQIIFIGSNSNQNYSKLFLSFMLFVPNIWDNVIPTAWSLSFELWFYIWIVFGMIFFENSKKYYVFLFLLIAAWNFCFVNFFRDIVFGGAQPLRYALTGLGLEFIAGVFLSIIYIEIKKSNLLIDYFLVAIVFLVFGSIFYTAGTVAVWFDRVEFFRAATFGAFGASILIVALSLDSLKIKAPNSLVLIGDSSYSLYLIHPFILDIFGKFIFKINLNGYFSAIFVIAMLLLIVYMSILWCKFIEKPFVYFANKIIIRNIFNIKNHN